MSLPFTASARKAGPRPSFRRQNCFYKRKVQAKMSLKHGTASLMLAFAAIAMFELAPASGQQTLTVPSTGDVVTSAPLDDGVIYLIEASGTYNYSGGDAIADAEWYHYPGVPGWKEHKDPWDNLDLLVNGNKVNWLGSPDGSSYVPHTFSPDHTYRYYVAGTTDPATFSITDTWHGSPAYGNNSGALTVSIQPTGRHTPPEPPSRAPEPDPVKAPEHTSKYEFVVGAQAGFAWQPLELGMEFELSVPGLDSVAMKRSAQYPEEPLGKAIQAEYGFGTNSWLLGETLSAIAPLEVTLAEINGAAGIEGTASLLAGAYLQDGENQADFEIEAGLGIQAYARAELSGTLIDPLKKAPVVGSYLDKEWEFDIPIVGTPTVNASASGFTLPWTFAYDDFRQDIAMILRVDPETLDDAGVEQHLVEGVPITFDPSDRKAGFQVGASARVYAETQLTASFDVYFLEGGDTAQQRSLGDVLGDVLRQELNLQEAVSATSLTGTVEFASEGGFGMTTGSPVWISSIVEANEPVNLLAFDMEFTSEMGAEGYLSIYWEDDLVATIDERLEGEGLGSYVFVLPASYEPGLYNLAFRLDSYTDVASSVFIDNVNLGYDSQVPEPATLGIFAFASLVLIRRSRCRP